MIKWAILGALTATIVLGYGGCPPRDTTLENPLLPRSWSQVHGDKENSGFDAVHSTYALAPLKKWSAPVGELLFASPVVAPDGTIYVGNVTGELVALKPDGGERWRRKLDESILASPAVNTQTGDVYVIGAREGSAGFESRLYHLNSTAGLLAVSNEPFSTSAAPKLWRDFVFVQSGEQLLAFRSAFLLGRVNTSPCFNIVCGGPDFSGWDGILLNIFLCVVTLTTGDFIGLTECGPGDITPGSISGPVEQPSVAIVDAATLAGDPNRPIIVAVSARCASAFRFYPDGDAPPVVPPSDPYFELLWSHALVEVDCDFSTVRSTTPAVVLGGQVIFGDQNGRVLSLDVLTGQEFWHEDLGEPVQCTPVAALRQIYVVTQSNMVMVDSDGGVYSRSALRGAGRGAALSLDYLYVTTTEGVHTFALDPQEGFAFDGSIVNETHFGRTFPALAEDGTVYVSTPTGFVHAYGQGQGFLARQVAIPQVTWQTPTDGAALSYAPGHVLSIDVSGPDASAFEGNVSFVSDRDGTLCEVEATAATASCATTKPLSLGTHELTAFATDVSGGTNSAVITVEIVDTPPAVAIAQPAEDAAFEDVDMITFEATVVDPEEPNFPPAHVQWTSNVAGELGTGLTLTRRLGAGRHTITATATDEHGETDSASVDIDVSGDAGPTVTITQPAEGASFFDFDLITFTASVVDPEEPDFPSDRVEWRSDAAGELGTGLTLKQKLPAGDHTITVVATDAQGVFGQANVHISVRANTSPTVALVAPVEGDVISDVVIITFTATVVDPDEPDFPPEHVRWQSDLAGDLGTGLSFQRTLPTGDQTITVTATDAQGASQSASVHIRVLAN